MLKENERNERVDEREQKERGRKAKDGIRRAECYQPSGALIGICAVSGYPKEIFWKEVRIASMTSCILGDENSMWKSGNFNTHCTS